MRIGEVLTMAEYIERDAVHDLVRSLTKYALASPGKTGHRITVDADDVNFGVDKIPSADVAQVRHARWDENGRCSNCGGHAPFWGMASTYYKSPWCQECGAKMDLEG